MLFNHFVQLIQLGSKFSIHVIHFNLFWRSIFNCYTRIHFIKEVMLGDLNLKLSVKGSLFLLVLSCVIASFVVNHLRCKVNKSFFDILNYFLAIIMELRLVKIDRFFIMHSVFLIVNLLLVLIQINILRCLPIGVHFWLFVIIFGVFLYFLPLQLLFFTHDHFLQ